MINIELGPYIENHENARQLIDWLINGSEDHFFSIRTQSCRFDECFDDYIHPEDLHGRTPAPHHTVCCVAGMAAIMAGVVTDNWPDCQKAALEWLGIDGRGNTHWFGFHPEAHKLVGLPPTGRTYARHLLLYSNHGID